MTQAARGSTYTWTATVRDGNGNVADATNLAITIADPDGDMLAGFPRYVTTVVPPAIIHDSLGEYHFDWPILAGADLGTYDTDWAGTVDGLAIGGSDSVEVVEAGTITTTVVSLEAVRAAMSTAMSDADLTGLIAREEAWFARQVSQIIGERTETFFRRLPVWKSEPLFLQRPTDAVTVVDNGVDVSATVRLLWYGTKVERTDMDWQGPVITVAYTPTDELEAQRAILELVRITLTNTPFESERIGEYSYARGTGKSVQAPLQIRAAIVKEFLPDRSPWTIRIPNTGESPRVGPIV